MADFVHLNQQSGQTLIPVKRQQRKSRIWLFVFLLIIFTVAGIGLGLAVGRGDIYVARVSAPKPGAATFNYSSVEAVYDALRTNYDGTLDKQKLLDGVKSGLVEAAGDPYTEYFNPEAAKTFNEALTGSFTGIGAELGTDDKNNIVIVSPLSGYPAQKAGLKPKDVIAAIDGQNTVGMTVSEAVKKIRGPEGSKVKLTISRGAAHPQEFEIVRAKITIASVESKIEDQIGYLKISQFTDDTVPKSQAAAAEFKKRGVKGIILDLRSNPGGYLSGAVDIASLWLDKGQTIVTERRGGQTLDTDYALGNNTLDNLPTVVLIDGGSASASEIVAGALRDNKAAKIVGVKSFGKGSVQQVEQFSDGSQLKVTVARWFTPAGKNIDKQGITPDVVVEVSATDQSASDKQKAKALELLKVQL